MNQYHKIQTVFKRNPATKYRTLLEGEWSLPEFEYLSLCEWVFTEKVDGTNIRIQYQDHQITFGGKTDRAQIPANLVNRLSKLFLEEDTIDLFFGMFGDGPVCLYGEGYGDKIQKAGKYYSADQDFILFDVKVGDWWLKRGDVNEIADKLGIDIVPILGTGTLFDMVRLAKAGIESSWGKFQAEGYVARPLVELKTRGGHRIITKIKCRDFPR